MTLLKKSVLAASAIALMTGVAYAADPVMYPEPAPVVANGSFDWDGFYAGLGITGASFSNGGPSETVGFLDLIVGGNITYDNFLFGAEAWFGGYRDSVDTGTGIGAEARAGYLVSDEVLVYTGVGMYRFDGGGQYTTVGLGTEFAVSDDVTIDLEYKYWGWSNTSFTAHSFGASALWHF